MKGRRKLPLSTSDQEIPVPDPIAPAAPAASTPSATPSAPSTPAPETFTPTSETPASGGPDTSGSTSSPDFGSTSEASDRGPEPQASDYPGDVEAHLRAHDAWERGEKVEAPKREGEAKPEVKPEEPEAKPEDQQFDKMLEEPEDTTPEAFASFIDERPALKAMLEADPKAKGMVFQMARENAKMKPIAELFPTVDSARFASDTASKYVDLRSSIMAAAESPDDMKSAVAGFMDEFKIVDVNGKPVLDNAGNPTYGDDLNPFLTTITQSNLQGRIDDLQAKLDANAFPSEEAKEKVELALNALAFANELISGEGEDNALDRPDTSQMSPEVRAYFERREKEVADKEKELGIKKQKTSQEEKRAARAAAEKTYSDGYGQTLGNFVGNFLQQQLKDNVHVPSWVMDVKDPTTGAPLFGVNAVNAFNKRIQSVPSFKAKLKELELAPVTPESQKARLDYSNQLIQDEMPAILKSELLKIQKKEMADSESRRQKREEGRKDARREPQSGSATYSVTGGLSEEQAYAKAKEQIETEFPDLIGSEKVSKTLQRASKLMRESA